MKRFLLSLPLLFVASMVQAQPRPGAFTTIVATDTSATAICVGCAIGSTTPVVNSGLIAQSITLPTGAPTVTTNKLYSVGGSLFFNGVGLAAGSSVSGTIGKLSKFLTINSLGDSLLSESGTTVTVGGTALTLSGVLSDTAFGAHAFTAGGAGGQVLTVRNTTAGTANYAGVAIGNDVSAALTVLQSLSSTYVTSGGNVANGSQLYAAGVGGLSILATDGAGVIRFYSGGVAEKMRLSATGGLSVGNTTDPGSGSLRLTGNSTVLGNEAVTGNLGVSGTTTLAAFSVSGNATIGSRFQVTAPVALTTATAGQMVDANGTFTVTLPAATTGNVVDVKNIGTGVITVAPASGTIDGAATYVLQLQYQSITVVADGTNWWIR